METGYKNTVTPMQYVCKCGKLSKISFCHFREGKRCKSCGIQRRSGESHPHWVPDRKLKKNRDKIRKKYYAQLSRTLKAMGKEKNNNSSKLLGYTIEDLTLHIQNHPNWPLVKNEAWLIDHIFPITAFILYGINDPAIVNSLNNLQPLSRIENSSKHNKFNKLEFENWLNRKGVTWKNKKQK